MPASQHSRLTLVALGLFAAAIIRPPLVQDYGHLLLDSVRNGTLSMPTVSDKFGQVWRSANLSFLLVYGLLAVVASVGARLHRAFTEPLAVYCDEARSGYFLDVPDSRGRSKEQQMKDIKRSRKAGDGPPMYPNGWMAVLRSSELKKKETKYMFVAGKNLAVFRGESGRAYIVDAYCAHLGANLAVGGSVHGDCIECPFHGWRYRGDDGKCVKIVYSEKVPDFAKISTYHCCEKNQRIFFWFHADGAEPSWEVPEIEEINSGELQYVGFWEIELDCHIEDIPENGVDISHFGHVHAEKTLLSTSDYELTDWAPDPKQKEIGIIKISTGKKLFGLISLPKNRVTAKQIGPCFSHVQLNHRYLGRVIYCETYTPIGPMRQRIVTTAFCERGPIIFYLNKKGLLEEYRQLLKDTPIWCNKMYFSKPLLTADDRLIPKHRKWYSQFYSESSPRYSQTGVDW